MRRYWLVVALAVGLAGGWLARGERGGTDRSHPERIEVFQPPADGKSGVTTRLDVFRVSRDGETVDVAPTPPGAGFGWRVTVGGVAYYGHPAE